MATQRDAAEDRAAVRWEQGRNKEGSKGGGGAGGRTPSSVQLQQRRREQEERDQLRSMGAQWGDGEGRLRANPEHGPF